ncbi:MAG: ABC transporter permease [Halanaerobiales bacterium]
MLSYIMRRIFYMIPTIIIISIITFIVIELPPGDFLTSYVVELQSQGAQVTEEVVESLRQRYGLGLPAHQRYFKWVRGILRGDFGLSFNWNRPVLDLIMERLPFTILISVLTLLVTYLVAIPVGIYSAVKQYSIGDYFFTTFGFLGLATPNFLLAIVLMFVFFRFFGISIGGLFSSQYRNAPWSLARLKDLINHLWIPIIVIGTAGTAELIRIMRGVLLDELGKDYIDTARSKGLKESVVIIKHAVRIALNPIISAAAFQLPLIISGEAITSIVLGLPTTGPLLLQALQTQDMYLAGSFIFLLSVLTVFGTFISDLVLAWVDPRIMYD